MHVAPAFVSVDARRDLILTVSLDKTARLWSPADGRLLRILRPPIGVGNEGKLYAGALSLDGAIAAVGGWTGYEWDGSHSVYLFETRSGKMLGRLTGLSDSIESLSFSPDGRLLAAGLDGRGGVRVWRVSDWQLAWLDKDYGDSVYGLDFTESGALVSSSLDGNLRRYDPQGKRERTVSAPGGRRPFGVSVSPDGDKLAVGYEDGGRVDVLSTQSLRFLARPDVTGIAPGRLSQVAWSSDGSALFAADSAQNADGRKIVRAWPTAGSGSYRDLPVADNTVLGLAPLQGSDFAFLYPPTRFGGL